jgi:hypothetical protein
VIFRTGPGDHSFSCKMGNGSFAGVNYRGRCVDHLPQCSAEVKERVELLLPFWAFVACSRVTFTFSFIIGHAILSNNMA